MGAQLNTHHSLFSSRHAIVREGVHVHKQRADDDDGCGEEHSVYEPLADDRRVLPPRRSAHDLRIYRVYAQGLARGTCARAEVNAKDQQQGNIWARTVHEDVDEEDLHRVQRVAKPEERTEGDQRQGRAGGTELERQEVLDVVEDGFAS